MCTFHGFNIFKKVWNVEIIASVAWMKMSVGYNSADGNSIQPQMSQWIFTPGIVWIRGPCLSAWLDTWPLFRIMSNVTHLPLPLAAFWVCYLTHWTQPCLENMLFNILFLCLFPRWIQLCKQGWDFRTGTLKCGDRCDILSESVWLFGVIYLNMPICVITFDIACSLLLGDECCGFSNGIEVGSAANSPTAFFSAV